MVPPRRSKSMDVTSTSHNSTVSVSSLPPADPELEQLAAAFEKTVKEEGLVKPHPCKRRMSVNLNLSVSLHGTSASPSTKTFSGQDAVTVLHSLMECETREAALEKGNEIMQAFRLFQHKDRATLPLRDSATDYYHFDCNLPSQVRKAKHQYKSYWEKAGLIEDHIELKDRRQMLDVFQDCFVAREAVDVIMNLKLVRTRTEAVHLMKKLNQKVFFCEHVYQEQEFKDENLWFTLIPHNERMREPHKRRVCSKSLDESIARINLRERAMKKTHRLEDIKKRMSLIHFPVRETALIAKEGGPDQPLPASQTEEIKTLSWTRRISLTGRAA
jgi:Domain found in Dishevelled, Egl-10, and Pleckstrin (DEP)